MYAQAVWYDDHAAPNSSPPTTRGGTERIEPALRAHPDLIAEALR